MWARRRRIGCQHRLGAGSRECHRGRQAFVMGNGSRSYEKEIILCRMRGDLMWLLALTMFVHLGQPHEKEC